MRKHSLFFLLFLMIVSLGFHLTTSLAQTVEQPQQSVIEKEAALIYENLTLLSINDRKEFYNELSPELKSELWKVHLKLYLAKNSDLNEKQIQAVEAVLTFIKPQLFEISQDNPEWEEKVNRPTQNLTKGILEVFPREVARELLTVLGDSQSSISFNIRRINYVPILNNDNCARPKQEIKPFLVKKQIKTQDQQFKMISARLVPENCDCSTRSDWCPQGTSCDQSPCQQQQFCGTMFLYICNGLCIIAPCSC